VEKEMKFELNLVQNNKEIQDLILDSIANALSTATKKSLSGIQKKIQKILVKKIKGEPEYDSLKNGQLRLEFGIPNTGVVDDIIDMWAANFVVENNGVFKKGSSISGSFSINMVKDDFADVLSSSAAIVYDTNTGAALPWLQWLLLDGAKILVRQHEVKIGPSIRSRTGMALMVESKKNWRVPSEFSGTISNNWITRALENVDKEISDIIKNEITSKL
jgi:hypothetical protein